MQWEYRVGWMFLRGMVNCSGSRASLAFELSLSGSPRHNCLNANNWQIDDLLLAQVRAAFLQAELLLRERRDYEYAT